MQDVGSWREYDDMGTLCFHVAVLESPSYTQDDLSHRWIRTWWPPSLCTMLCNRCCEVTEDVLGV